MTKTVFIGQGDFRKETVTMFTKAGFTESKNLAATDILCLIGGIDVNPFLYGEKAHPTTYARKEVDDRDIELIDAFDRLHGKKAAKVGICRGGQLLNVLAGGRMWQDVNNHSFDHTAMDKRSGTTFIVTSIHHQEMRPSPKGVILATATVATQKSGFTEKLYGQTEDVEAVWYPHTKSLCFQPHPEFEGVPSTENYFWSLVSEFINPIKGW